MAQANDLELYMLDLINADRAALGLSALQLETNLNESAEEHSDWMLETNTFSHTGEDGSSATERMVDAGFDLDGSWQTAENLAIQTERGEEGLYDDVEDLHESLMDSPGHRENLLDPDLEYIGIGIEEANFTYDNGYAGNSVIVTQNFAATDGEADLDPGTGGAEVQSVAAAPAETAETEAEPEVSADEETTETPADGDAATETMDSFDFSESGSGDDADDVWAAIFAEWGWQADTASDDAVADAPAADQPIEAWWASLDLDIFG